MSRPPPAAREARHARLGALLRWACGAGIVTIAVMRCAISFVHLVVFDVDPALDPAPLPGLGPAGSLLLDALLLGAAACGVAGEVLARRRIDWLLWALALLPVPVVLWHGSRDLGDLFVGSTWAAAAVAAVTLAHLGRGGLARPVLAALLIAVMVPVGVRGAAQCSVTVGGRAFSGPEHVETVRMFEESREAFLAERGWEPGSPAAAVFERRLRRGDPRGWFSTSNILASVMAAGAVLAAGLAAGLIGALERPRSIVLPALLAALGAAGVLLARSKGALLALLAGLCLRFAPLSLRPVAGFFARSGGWFAVASVIAVLTAVAFRGVLLPESFLGDRSLLFRWHYQVGAARVIAAEGLRGVGPDGFQEAYAGVRLPRSPEEVRSAHSVFLDWLATLGAAGAAWALLLLVLVWRAGARLAPAEGGAGSGAAPGGRGSRAPLVAAAVVALAGFVPALACEAASLAPSEELFRIVGVTGYVLVAAGLGAVLGGAGRRALDPSLAAAAVAIAIHGQIEMTFFEPGSVVWMMCVLGLAGAVAGREGTGARAGRASAVAGAALCGGLLTAALWLATSPAYEAGRAREEMVLAASRLHPPAPTPEERVAQRENAALHLVYVHDDRVPTDARVLEAAVRQLLVAAELAAGARRPELVEGAVALAERAVTEHGTATSCLLASEAHRLAALSTGDPAHWEAAIGHARHLTAIDPHGISSWKRLGDLLWESGRRDEAAAAYARALLNDRNFELDPLEQLPPSQRDRLQERIDEVAGGKTMSAAPRPGEPVPEALRPFLPFVERWGAIRGDEERYALADRAESSPEAMREIEEFCAAWGPEHANALERWLDRVSITDNETAARFSYTFLLIDELDLELPRLRDGRDRVDVLLEELDGFGSERKDSLRMWAARSLPKYGDDATRAVPRLFLCLADPDLRVRIWAHAALARLEGDEAGHTAAIAELGRSSADGGIAREAEEALEELDRTPQEHDLEALCSFCILGDLPRVRRLAARVEVDALDHNGQRPLLYAVGNGHVEAAQVLLEHGADPNRRSAPGDSYLHKAATRRRGAAMIELLLAHGAEVNARDRDGRTPLDRAREHGRAENARLLESRGGRSGAPGRRH